MSIKKLKEIVLSEEMSGCPSIRVDAKILLDVLREALMVDDEFSSYPTLDEPFRMFIHK